MSQCFVTKHCAPANKDRMLDGKFRIGTIMQYATTEGGGLFDDKNEGHAANRLLGDQIIDTMVLPGGATLKNVKTFGFRTAISQEFKINAHVFCASNGDYNLDRHAAILQGNDKYPPNESYTAYAVLDKLKLSCAISAAIKEATSNAHDIFGMTVTYGNRASEHTDQKSFSEPRAYTSAALKAAFHKPTRFGLEEEYRFMAVSSNPPNKPIEVIDTENLSETVRAKFKNAILRVGEFVKETLPAEGAMRRNCASHL